MKLHLGEKLALPVDFVTAACVVYGGRGSGKTTFGTVVAEELYRAGQRFCAIDLKGDYWGFKSSADGKSEGLPVLIFGGDHADLPLEENAGEFLGGVVAELEQPCVLDLEHLSKGKQIRFLGSFLTALYHKNRAPLMLIMDEAHRSGARDLPRRERGHRAPGAQARARGDHRRAARCWSQQRGLGVV